MAYGGIWLLSLLPLRVLYLFSDLLYLLLYHVARYRRKVVRSNLSGSFPEKGIGEIRKIEKKFYRHLCDVFVEMYALMHLSEREIRRRCVFKRTDILQQYYDRGRSVIGVTGHLGNWEWMSSYALWTGTDIDCMALYKPIHNRVFDRMMLRIRSRFGAVPMPKNEAFRRLVSSRRAGRLFMAAFIADQTPSSGNLSFWMEFLNRDTAVLSGPERIATQMKLPVVSLYMRKIRRGYYEVEFVELCEDPEKLAPGELTRMYMKLLEQQIREHPEYWLWSHKRWKHKREKNG
jgi:KDO2-lipid IV(A) lauroyltransferase